MTKVLTKEVYRMQMQKCLENRMHILEKGMRRVPQDEAPAHGFSGGKSR